MNIVVLDGFTLNPGDLDWNDLEQLGRCRIYDRTAASQIAERAADAEALLTNKTVLSREQIDVLPNLRYIGVLATGYNVVDLQAASDRGIVVTNIPAYSTRSVAQMVFALLLEITQQVGHHDALVKSGWWAKCDDFSFTNRPLYELAGEKMGLVGFGQIGQAVAKIADAFGMKVLVHTRTVPETVPSGIHFVELDELLCQADVISLHCPLTEQTTGMINTDSLARMKSSTILINTGRGPLLDEQAVADALNRGTLRAAAFDALSSEPPAAENPLLNAANTFITPHIAWATDAARRRLMAVAVENLRRWQGGDIQNQVY